MTFDMGIEEFDIAKSDDEESAEGPRSSHADPGRPPRLGALVWVALAAVAVLAGFLVLGSDGQESADDGPDPAPTATATSPSPWRPGQRQYLGVTRICGPVTDGRRTLAISFEVSNISPSPVEIQSVVGVLPEGGLRQRGPATRGGSCNAPGTQSLRTVLLGDRSRFYTLTFDLPKSCPARYPVLVRIGFTARDLKESSLSLLQSDLSVPEFDTCGPAETTATPRGASADSMIKLPYSADRAQNS
jgi:hypothetical protein